MDCTAGYFSSNNGLQNLIWMGFNTCCVPGCTIKQLQELASYEAQHSSYLRLNKPACMFGQLSTDLKAMDQVSAELHPGTQQVLKLIQIRGNHK